MAGINENRELRAAPAQHQAALSGTRIDADASNQSREDRLLSNYNYDLPQERIAQTPLRNRDHSRLLVVDSPTHQTHCRFWDLPQLLRPQDLLVLNNTRVIPARLYGQKSTGAPVEVLLLEERQPCCWLALVKPGRRLKVGAQILFEPHSPQAPTPTTSASSEEVPPPLLKATVLARDEATNGRLLQFEVPPGASLAVLLAQYGQLPLPPTSPIRKRHQSSIRPSMLKLPVRSRLRPPDSTSPRRYSHAVVSGGFSRQR